MSGHINFKMYSSIKSLRPSRVQNYLFRVLVSQEAIRADLAYAIREFLLVVVLTLER